ncbi:MAG: MogA/MoaB family molybdenum cofactor biosynthesis protein [Clostridia bacterium]|nr:MogA/MoaB family molybdenum cofactor biosynthesis protein [Clostridia bacterium]
MAYRVAVITLSDKGARGEREDKSGPVICEMVQAAGYEVVLTELLNDDREGLKNELIRIADEHLADLILTTGGTGFSQRDNAPEATMDAVERNVPGIAEAMRVNSLKITPRGMLSRAASGIRKYTLIINLPGSPKAVKENL